MCVATNAGSETFTISLPQCINASVASLVTNGTGRIAFAIVEAGSPIPSSSAFPPALSDSFLWQGILISNCSEPEQLIRIWIELR